MKNNRFWLGVVIPTSAILIGFTAFVGYRHYISQEAMKQAEAGMAAQAAAYSAAATAAKQAEADARKAENDAALRVESDVAAQAAAYSQAVIAARQAETDARQAEVDAVKRAAIYTDERAAADALASKIQAAAVEEATEKERKVRQLEAVMKLSEGDGGRALRNRERTGFLNPPVLEHPELGGNQISRRRLGK